MDRDKPRGVTVVIPVYNECEAIGGVLEGVRAVLGEDTEIIVVDDGSTDGTWSVAEREGVRVIRHPYRKGNGAAVKTGIRQASGGITVLLDGDGQHPPAKIPLLLEGIGRYEMVVGARQNYGKISPFRQLGNRIYNILAGYVTGMRIEDLTSGFRVIRTDLMRRYLYLLPNGYSYPTTITLALIKAGYSVQYIPFICSTRLGRSKLHPFRDGIRFFIILLRIATLFSPMKIFAPLSGVFLTLGLLIYVFIFTTASRFPKTSLLLFIVGAMIFLMGLIAEQIAMLRMETRE